MPELSYIAVYVFQNFCLGLGFGLGGVVAYAVGKKVGVV